MTDPNPKLRSIREFLADAAPVVARHMHELCEKHGIDLDSPWPPRFPKEAEPEPKTPAKILQFPLPFGEDTRAVSNPMARCPLFAPVKERQHFKDYVTVSEEGGCIVEFRGEQLNQDDHDTLLQLVRMALHKPFGEDVRVSVNSTLLGMGRTTRPSQRRQFFGSSVFPVVPTISWGYHANPNKR